MSKKPYFRIAAILSFIAYSSMSFCADEAKGALVLEAIAHPGDYSFSMPPSTATETTATLAIPTTFLIDNALGATVVEGIDSDRLSIKIVSSEGEKPVSIKLIVLEDGKMKIQAQYSDQRGGASIISYGGGGVSFIGIGGGTIVSGGNIIVNGRRVNMLQETTVDFKIGIPNQLLANIKATSTNGAIEIRNFPELFDVSEKRTVFTETTNGDTHLENIEALEGVTSKSTNGAIDMNLVYGGRKNGLQAKVTNGSISATGIGGEINFEATNGSITSNISSSGDFTAKTTNGGIHISNHIDGGVRGESNNGAVILNNPKATFEDAKSRNGQTRTSKPAQRPKGAIEQKKGLFDF